MRRRRLSVGTHPGQGPRLIERVAGSGRDEDVDMLEDLLSLMGRYGPSGPEEAVGSIGAGVGHKAMVNIFPSAAAW
jgi:hypothetical protein